jgi:hypothetical protein
LLLVGNAFIGLQKMEQSPDDFTNWINNASLTFEGWQTPIPSSSPGDGHNCVYIQQGFWVKYYCGKVLGYICEKNVTYEKLTYT